MTVEHFSWRAPNENKPQMAAPIGVEVVLMLDLLYLWSCNLFCGWIVLILLLDFIWNHKDLEPFTWYFDVFCGPWILNFNFVARFCRSWILSDFCCGIMTILGLNFLLCHGILRILDPELISRLGILKILNLEFCYVVGSWEFWIQLLVAAQHMSAELPRWWPRTVRSPVD